VAIYFYAYRMRGAFKNSKRYVKIHERFTLWNNFGPAKKRRKRTGLIYLRNISM
jgi:hypothetical protein